MCIAITIIAAVIASLLSLPIAVAEPYSLSSSELRQQTFIPNTRMLAGQHSSRLQQLWRTTGVRLLTLENPAALGRYRCQVPDKALLNRALDSTLQVIDRYPTDFFGRAKVRFLVLCSRLTDDGGGRPGAIPNAGLGVLVVDLSYPSSPAGYRAGLHHEFYHMFDFALDGRFTDPDWERLNPLGFRYVGHGRLHRQASARLGSGGRGFITAYAQAAVEEDKAELFRALATEPQETWRLARQDAILRQKIERLQDELKRAGGLDARFWQR